ncbi:MAG: hypothetical protein ACFE0Q_21300 [Anaerolineae bacterium]
MRLFKTLVFLCVASVILTACGGTADDTEATLPADDADTSTETDISTSAGFNATITGATEEEIISDGYFMCEDSAFGELAINAHGTMTNNIFLLVPIDASAGDTYELVSERMSADQASAAYSGDSIDEGIYENNVSGTINLTAVPSAPGDAIAGTFEFTADTGEEGAELITVTGAFDFTAGENAYLYCEGN